MRTPIVSLALAVVLTCAAACAQWLRTNGPYGGYITSLAIGGTDIYAGTYGGVFRSTDNGKSWTLGNAGLTHGVVQSLAVSGSNLFAGIRFAGICLSSDEGQTWTPINNGISQPGAGFPAVWALAVRDTRLFAGTDWGVYVSIDNGTSWNSVNSGLGSNLNIKAFTISGTNLFGGTDAGVVLSTDNGASWAGSGLTSQSVTALAVSGTSLFAGTQHGVFLSTDNGTTWTATDSVLSNTYVSSLAVSGKNLFAGTVYSRWEARQSGDVYLSTNNGATWTTVNKGLLHTAVWSLAVSGTDIIAGTDCGVFVSADSGSTWVAACAVGAPGVHISALSVQGAELFAATGWQPYRSWTRLHACIYHSTDNGDSWVPQLAVKANAFAVHGNAFFAATDTGVFRTTDHGSTWTSVNKGLPRSTYDTTRNVAVQCIASMGQKLFAGTSEGSIYVTTNSGAQWAPAFVGATTAEILQLAIAYQNVFASAAGGGVFMSTNNGTTWTAANAGLPEVDRTWIYSFAVSGSNVFAGPYLRGIYRFDYSSQTWTAANQGLPLNQSSIPPSYPNFTCFFVDGLNILGASEVDRFFLSTNSGASWQLADSGSVDLVCTLNANESFLFAGTGVSSGMGEGGNGLWRRKKSQIVSVEGSIPDIPTPHSLWQNFPNPFNPTTVISYQLPVVSDVKLVVYDMLGREVSVLVNERRDAGSHEVKFDASRLSSGVYFYRLQARQTNDGQAGSFTQTRRLVLLK